LTGQTINYKGYPPAGDSPRARQTTTGHVGAEPVLSELEGCPHLASRARLGRESRYNADMSHNFSCGQISFLALLFVIFLSAALSVVAQNPQPQSPGEISKPAPLPEAPPQTPPHAFWDRTNILLFAGVAVFRSLDYASTRNFLARGRVEVLIPDDVVNNSAGFASLEAAGTLTSVGLSYLMHRTGHHKLERWISIGHIGVTGFGVVRNYSLKSKHP
jgi:hypothetical protein